jgi:solute carrier family 25 (adenine nucleotide translocator) protein 4/5/6/31
VLFVEQGMMRGTERHYNGMIQSLMTVTREEGIFSLWKGNGANVVRVVPVYALKFALNDFFKDTAISLRGSQPPSAGSDQSSPHGSIPYKLSFWEKALAGSLAGLFQIVATYPLEVVRTRLTMGPGLGIQYKGILDCFSQTLRNEGVTGLYKGIGPTMLSGAPYVGLQMSCYDALKTAVTQIEALTTETGDGTRRPLVVAQLACGATAGMFAQTGERGLFLKAQFCHDCWHD